MSTPGPSALRVLLTSFWVLYRVTRTSLRLRMGGPLSYLLNLAFTVGIVAQVGVSLFQQHRRIAGEVAGGAFGPSGRAAGVFALDVIGMLLLLVPAMIRADGIAGKRRAAVDTELWLTLPLTGPQRVVARLGQATFFLTFLGIFLVSHFLAPALAFAPSPWIAAPVFLALSLSAAAIILGGGAGLYAIVRRFVPPKNQGQLVAWTGLGLLPLGYAFFAVAQGRGGRPADALGALLQTTPVAGLLRAVHRADLFASLAHGALLVTAGVLAGWLGWLAAAHFGRESVDDITLLGGGRRYPGGDGRLSHLAKDLRLRWRDPSHRGALIGALLASWLLVIIDVVSGGQLAARWQRGSEQQVVLSLCCFSVGLGVLVSAGQWLALETRSLDLLRISGIEPAGLLWRKGLCASVEAVALATPVGALMLLRAPQMARYLSVLLLFAIGMAWFMTGDTAARFPQARRDTRPIQVRSLYAGYLVMLAVTVVMPLSLRAAVLALSLLAMGALGRLDAGVDALTHIDDVRPPERPVRFADAWLAGAAAAAAQGIVALTFSRLWPGAQALLVVVCAYGASALLLGGWAALYLRRRPAAEEGGRSVLAELLGPPAAPRAYLYGLGFGLVSAMIALTNVLLLPRIFPSWPGALEKTLAAPLWLRLLGAVTFTVLAPLTEELFFRGWILRGLSLRLDSARRLAGAPLRPGGLAIALQALLFMILHPTLSYLPVLVLGVCTGLVVRRTGSLRPALLAHAVHNAPSAVLLVLG